MTTTKERPIIFSAEMVNAILSDQKTQTRREVKFNEPAGVEPLPHVEYARDGMPIWWSNPPTNDIRQSDYYDTGYPCPYGKVGDKLWVRESFAILSFGGSVAHIRYAADGATRVVGDSKLPSRCRSVPSKNMPRQVARITIEITSVRVERLNEISEADARAEGCNGDCPVGSIPRYQAGPASYHFAYLWDLIHGTGAWSANPWVWVITFRRLK